MGVCESIRFKAPSPAKMPHLLTMLNSIGSDAAAARLLGVTCRTLSNYRKQGQAPRAVMLALFWETPWGLSVLDCGVVNEARMSYAKSVMLERENGALKAQIAKLESMLSEAGKGAANEHFYRVGVL